MNKLFTLIVGTVIAFSSVLPAFAQEPQPTQQPTAEDLEKQKAEWTKNAFRLLDQVVDESQNLRLTENRVRVQIIAADILWDRNQDRARSLFALAGDGVAELMRSSDTNNNRQNFNQVRRPSQLRQQLILAVARHDAPLAYQLLASTKPPVQTQTATDPRNPLAMALNSEDNLEQNLLSTVAALDPKLAAQNADQMLEKGQFPRSLTEVISQLQRQDKEAAAKLTDKTVKRLQSSNLLANNNASTLALGLLLPGPRLAASTDKVETTTATSPKQQPTGPSPVLDQSSYSDLMGTVIDSALKATPQAQNNQRAGNNQRARQGIGGGPNGGGGAQNNNQNAPTDAQIEQASARRLLSGLQNLLPQVDQYLPSRAQSVRQKLTELGMGDQRNFAQAISALQGSDTTTENLLQAAASAPPQFQTRIYQQAAYKALDEGNTDQARQIANDHLQNNARDTVLQRADFRELAKKAETTRIDEIRQNLARLRNDTERIDLLIQMSTDLQTKNPKLAKQLLEEARQMTNRRATSYDNFEQQLKVAHAFAAVEPARSFEVLDPGISQLNELLSAAALLSGFEVNIFMDGELPLQGGNGLTSMVSRYGDELAELAKTDFERSETLAGRFQLTEPRILARLSIVQTLLGTQTNQRNPNLFRFGGQNFNIGRPN